MALAAPAYPAALENKAANQQPRRPASRKTSRTYGGPIGYWLKNAHFTDSSLRSWEKVQKRRTATLFYPYGCALMGLSICVRSWIFAHFAK